MVMVVCVRALATNDKLCRKAMTKPVNPLTRQISLRVETIFALASGNAVHQAREYELELRFGCISRGAKGDTFDAHVPCYLALALFQFLCHKAAVELCGDEMREIEREQEAKSGEKRRVMHEPGHIGCKLVHKKALMTPSDFSTSKNVEADVRVALECETLCGTLPKCGGPRHPFSVVRRRRRSLRFVDSERGADDFWRLDVTRLNGGAAYQLELELEFERAMDVLRVEQSALAASDPEAFQEHAKREIATRGLQLIGLIEHHMVRAAEHYDTAVARIRT